MKKTLIVLGIIAMGILPVLAEEPQANQDVTVELNKAVITVAKQPASETSVQKVVVKDNWFSIVLVINGKTPFDKTDNK